MAAEKENDRRARVRDLEKMWTAGYKTTARDGGGSTAQS